MHYKDLITFSDLTKLTKDQLIDIATDMSLKEASDSTQLIDIASAIYEKTKNSAEAGNILETRKNIIFAGRGSVGWFTLASSTSGNVLEEYIKYLKEKDQAKPFEKSKLQNDKNLTNLLSGVKNTVPILLGGIDNGDTVLLRYAIRSGIRTEVNVFTAEEVPRIEIVTVLLVPSKDLIEIRASNRSASKVYRAIVSFIKENIVEDVKSKQFSFKNDIKTADPVKYLADKLKGQVSKNVDIPSKNYATMSDEEKESISQILEAINERLNDTDGADSIDINAIVDNAKGSLADNFSGISFTELILNGLTKVDLSSIKELLNTPLYSSLSNHLITKTTYIRFPVITNGSTENITIRVGLTVNTVVFSSRTTEEAIQAVRKILFN
ncbi:hypothetical protein [Lactobacillus paragasseri]|uniref:Uncharacterized protein n=1 Tax=Lactobacillus paragasseri TaxID=2107999 RepID=A0ABD5A186_9LACO|nr:hypothetical protein [Lactobacillus paragasseri]MDO6361334.1 hypothetical protein [Lactobacillus paragasseri]